jgi:HAD superfamily hydrolase (TIGR01509 family)
LRAARRGQGLSAPTASGVRPLPFDLVIFDCDGVLVDSEILCCRVHAQALTRHGYPIGVDAVHARFLGRSFADATREIEAEIGRPLPLAFHDDYRATLNAALAAEVEAMPHLRDALDAIASKVCVASSGSPDKIATSLTRTGLLDRFAPHIFSASQVARGKPAPDLFLFAAAGMGVAPRACLVVEDSAPGVAAAVAAGMTALGFVGGSHCRPGDADRLRAAGAHAIVADMRGLESGIRAVDFVKPL